MLQLEVNGLVNVANDDGVSHRQGELIKEEEI